MFPTSDDQNPYSSAYQEPGSQPLEVRGQIRPTIVSAGDVLNHASEMFKRHWGALVGAFVIVFVISMIHGFVNGLIQLGIEGMPQPQQNPFGPGGGGGMNFQTYTPLSLGLQLIANAVQIFLGIGATRMYLSAARDESPDLGLLFSGGPWFWRVVGFSILFGLALGLGFVLLIIPGIIMALMWWPARTIIIDNQAGVMDSFGLAAQITKGNKGTTFVLFLATIGITILGFVALCVGLIAAIPFTYLIWTSAYLLMSGQVGRYGMDDESTMDYGFDKDFPS